MKYRINLVRDMQREKRDSEIRQVKTTALIALSFGLLAVSLFYGLLQVSSMRSNVQDERARLRSLKVEYQHYRASKMIVNKSDIELLDRLQNTRIFWTRILVPMASDLPENYWITQFSYNNSVLSVEGYGYINSRQQQLITLDDYLNSLRNDKMFNNPFKQVRLTSTVRNDDEQKRERVSFSFSASGGK